MMTTTLVATATAVRAQSDPDLFFQEYTKAARLLREGKPQDAAITVDLLQQRLTVSPWREIAVLKHGEMNESRNGPLAMEAYVTLRKLLDETTYFQEKRDREQLFRRALEGALERGVKRVRLRHIAQALGVYLGTNGRYPGSLATLAVLGLIKQEDIADAKGRPIRYTPGGPALKPSVAFMSYQLEHVSPEPFVVKTPRIDGTSLISDNPRKYTALIRVPGGGDARRVVEFQTLEGFFIAAIAEKGAIVCTPDRVLVLPVAK